MTAYEEYQILQKPRGRYMTFDEYQIAAQRTSNARFMGMEAQIQNGAMGLAGEAGEVVDLVKKWMFQGHSLDREKVIDECGDVCWYLAELATGIGVPLGEFFEHNIEKLRERYPQGFDANRSRDRKEHER